MRTLLLLMLMSASACLAQEVPLALQQSSTDPQQQVPATQPDPPLHDPSITVLAGTRVELALANPLHRRNAHVGDTVRAVTSFPITVGQDLAIPQGSFVEGRIVKVGKHGPTRFDGLQIEFKQLVLANGYNVALDGSVVDAMASLLWVNQASPRQQLRDFIANSFQQQPPSRHLHRRSDHPKGQS